ncbi:MAG: hypothetical protein E6R08_06325 [Nevskiaceae bacterium]|nr:MAG: hypothetical protein E6R08_06325 [Nevskiaceae bacterium]
MMHPIEAMARLIEERGGADIPTLPVELKECHSPALSLGVVVAVEPQIGLEMCRLDLEFIGARCKAHYDGWVRTLAQPDGRLSVQLAQMKVMGSEVELVQRGSCEWGVILKALELWGVESEQDARWCGSLSNRIWAGLLIADELRTIKVTA